MKIFNKKLIRTPNIHYKDLFSEMTRNAHVDWIIILLIVSIIAIIFIAGGFFLYKNIYTGNFAKESEDISKDEEIFNQKDLDFILNDLSKRENTVSQINREYIVPVDPSR